MRFFIGQIEDNFIITPALIVSLGRCESCPKIHGFSIMLSWLTFEVGFEFVF